MPQKHSPITVYVNPHGDVVVRQQGDTEDQVIVVSADYVPVLVLELDEARRAASDPA